MADLITPTPIPTSAPVPDPSDESTYDQRAYDFDAWMRNTLSPGINTQAAGVYQNAQYVQEKASAANTSAGSAATSATTASTASQNAASSANFKGAWSGLTGGLTVPASVAHNSKLWLLLNNLANVTTSQPGVSADWVDITASKPGANSDITSLSPTTGGLQINGRTKLISDSEKYALELKYSAGANGVFVGATATGDLVICGPGGNELVKLDASGSLLIVSGKAMGYGIGAGGTVTQSTSKSTAVTLNKPTGKITMNNAPLGAGAVVGFVFNNSFIGANDVLSVSIDAASANFDYILSTYCALGYAYIRLKNDGSVSRSEPIGINFQIGKGATS